MVAGSAKGSGFGGWPVVGWVVLALAVWVGSAFFVLGLGEHGVAYATRTTARVAFLLFMISLAAPALGRARNQRALFVAFAACHVIHLGTIVALAVITSGENVGRGFDPSHVAGGIAYLFVVWIAIGYVLGREWRLVETFGTFAIWVAFMLAYTIKAIESPAFWLLPAIGLAAGLLRVFTRREGHPGIAEGRR